MHDVLHDSPEVSQQAEPVYQVRSLSFRYPDGQAALEDVDLTIFQGDRVALVGHNGAGKTTLLKHLCGIFRAGGDHIRYHRAPITEDLLFRLRTEVGVLFQDPDDQLFCNTLYEDVAFGPRNQGLDADQVDQRVRTALEQVDLTHLLYRAPHLLSYGQKKRAALATLFAMNPQVLILDEPTANLDPRQEQLVCELLQQFPGTLICVSHDLPLLYQLCTRALVLSRGCVHHDYTMQELVSEPDFLRDHGLGFTFHISCCRDDATPRMQYDHHPLHQPLGHPDILGHHEPAEHDEHSDHSAHPGDHELHLHHPHSGHPGHDEHAGPPPHPAGHPEQLPGHQEHHEHLGPHLKSESRQPEVEAPPVATGQAQGSDRDSDQSPLIRLHDYSQRYPDLTWGLRQVDFTLREGENVALVGCNGAGKSTLAQCLMGILAGNGEYRFDGEPVTPKTRNELWRSIGMVFQDPADQLVCPNCYDEVAFGPRNLGLEKGEIAGRVAEAFEVVGLTGFEHRVPHHLSGGEKRRLVIASVLSMQPRLLILDEPSVHLDPQSEAMLRTVLRRLPMTKIIITHDMDLILTLCTRTVVLHDGKIIRDYSTGEFHRDDQLVSINGLDYSYRNRCCHEIAHLRNHLSDRNASPGG